MLLLACAVVGVVVVVDGGLTGGFGVVGRLSNRPEMSGFSAALSSSTITSSSSSPSWLRSRFLGCWCVDVGELTASLPLLANGSSDEAGD